MPGVDRIDLGYAISWEYDRDFFTLIEREFRNAGMTTYLVDGDNVDETLRWLKGGRMELRVVLDRASDEDERFHAFARWVSKKFSEEGSARPRPINPHTLLDRASDKATMHLEFLAHGIRVPYTIIISPFNHRREVELSLSELAQLGRPFIIKPANTTGGGIGVVTGAESLKDIISARQHHKNDKYLLQETIRAAELGGRSGWFRVFYAFGRIIPCWWDVSTHVYTRVSDEDQREFDLGDLRAVTHQIHDVCALDFFSTEIAYTPSRSFVVVDYVNEMCDMRLKSVHHDGVPDDVVLEIVQEMRAFVSGVNQHGEAEKS